VGGQEIDGAGMFGDGDEQQIRQKGKDRKNNDSRKNDGKSNGKYNCGSSATRSALRMLRSGRPLGWPWWLIC
jgi:hypothetical protein